MSLRKRIGLALTLPLFMGAPSVMAATAEEDLVNAVKSGPLQKLGPVLANLYEEYSASTSKKTFKTKNPLVNLYDGKVGIDLYAADAASLERTLAKLGATRISTNGKLLSALVPVKALGELAASASLEFAEPALAKLRVASQGAVVSQGDRSLNSDTVRNSTGLDGAGVTIGLLSDSYGCNPPAFVPGAPTTTAEEDEAAAEVPPNVDVLSDACPGNSDEGRGMAQLAHDVAPGAAMKFHTAFISLRDFADGILRLQEAGSDVIVDDVIYFAENMFSDGIIAQAADEAVERGSAYFSSAGNDARLSYESGYREIPVSTNGSGNARTTGKFTLFAHDFGGGDTLQQIQVTPGAGGALVVFSFQWDQPFLSSTTYAHQNDPEGATTPGPVGASSDLDLLIYDSKGILVRRCPPGTGTGITCQLTGTRNIGRDAVDIAALFVTGPKDKVGTYFVRFVRAGGPAPSNVKYVAFELAGAMDIVEHDTASGTAYGHSNAQDIAAVGASSWYLTEEFDSPPDFYFSTLVQDTPGACVPAACLNVFSSAGGVPIYLDKYGTRLAGAEVRQTPRFTGPDGGNTTFFIADSSFDDDDGDGCNSPTSVFITPCLDNPADELPNFFGTSASAPHVSGVAALMLQKNAGLEAQQIYDILQDTSEDMTKREVAIVPGPGNSVFSPLPAGYDFDSGQGFVNAVRAIAATPGT